MKLSVHHHAGGRQTGIYRSKEIADQLDEEIMVESEFGKGLSFSIALLNLFLDIFRKIPLFILKMN